jgi:hypothetical protein
MLAPDGKWVAFVRKWTAKNCHGLRREAHRLWRVRTDGRGELLLNAARKAGIAVAGFENLQFSQMGSCLFCRLLGYVGPSTWSTPRTEGTVPFSGNNLKVVPPANTRIVRSAAPYFVGGVPDWFGSCVPTARKSVQWANTEISGDHGKSRLQRGTGGPDYLTP